MLWIGLAVVLGLLVIAEVGLRLSYGFGNPLVYITDPEIGYLLAPNQRTRRSGNRIEINQYSMRSGPIEKSRPSGTLRLFLLGDSIANGGWWTDQAKILSSLLATQLQGSPIGQNFKQIEVLNASANSWCPRNEVAYLRRYGTFESQVVVLLINTDDLFGTAPTSIPVGRDRYYPSQKPSLALVEALTRLLPYSPPPEMAQVNAEKGDRVGANLAAIQEIGAIVQSSQAQLLVAMTPLKREIGTPGPKDYELTARQRLLEHTQSLNIPYIDFLPIFNAVQTPESLYRDHIHINELGNQRVSEEILKYLPSLLP